MKEKMKRRVQMRHEISDHGKVDRVVEKSFRKEATHKMETSSWSNGFITAIMKWIKKLSGFFKKRQPLHTGTSTKSYCQKFGGAFGGSKKVKHSYKHNGYVGAKQENRLQKAIVRNGGVDIKKNLI